MKGRDGCILAYEYMKQRWYKSGLIETASIPFPVCLWVSSLYLTICICRHTLDLPVSWAQCEVSCISRTLSVLKVIWKKEFRKNTAAEKTPEADRRRRVARLPVFLSLTVQGTFSLFLSLQHLNLLPVPRTTPRLESP